MQPFIKTQVHSWPVIADIRPSAALFEGSHDSPECLSDKSSDTKVQFVPHSEQFASIRMTSRLLVCGGFSGFDGANRAMCVSVCVCVCLYIYIYIIEWQAKFLTLKQAFHTFIPMGFKRLS